MATCRATVIPETGTVSAVRDEDGLVRVWTRM